MKIIMFDWCCCSSKASVKKNQIVPTPSPSNQTSSSATPFSSSRSLSPSPHSTPRDTTPPNTARVLASKSPVHAAGISLEDQQINTLTALRRQDLFTPYSPRSPTAVWTVPTNRGLRLPPLRTRPAPPPFYLPVSSPPAQQQPPFSSDESSDSETSAEAMWL